MSEYDRWLSDEYEWCVREQRRLAGQREYWRGYVTEVHGEADVHRSQIEKVMEKKRYFGTPEEAEDAYARYDAHREPSEEDKREAELDKRQHELMDAVPDDMSGWATFPLQAPGDRHHEWIAARRQYVHTGDPGDLDSVRSYVTFESPPLLSDVRPATAPAGQDPRVRRTYAGLSAVSAVVSVPVAASWAFDPYVPLGIPVTAVASVFLVVLWYLCLCSLRKS